MVSAGDRVTWMHEPRGGYGYQIPVDATVVRVGPRRVLIEAVTAAGVAKQVWVAPERLRAATEASA